MQHLIDAYTNYQAAVAAHEAEYPFDFLTFLDTPEAPKQSPEARAGELLQGGLVAAMRHMLLIAADRPLSEYEQQVATLLAVASVEMR